MKRKIPEADSPAAKRLVCFGNSITEGWMVSSDESYPAVLAGLCPAEVINCGVSGETSRDGLMRFDRVLGYGPTACIVEFGINDFFMGYDVKQVEDNLSRILKALVEKGIRPGIMGFSFPDGRTRQWEEMYAKSAGTFDIPLLPDLFQALRGTPDTFMPDGVHPTAAGYRIIAANCMKAFSSLWE